MNNSGMLIELENKTELNTQHLYKINRKDKEKLPFEAYAFLPKSHQQSPTRLAGPCIQRLLLS